MKTVCLENLIRTGHLDCKRKQRVTQLTSLNWIAKRIRSRKKLRKHERIHLRDVALIFALVLISTHIKLRSFKQRLNDVTQHLRCTLTTSHCLMLTHSSTSVESYSIMRTSSHRLPRIVFVGVFEIGSHPCRGRKKRFRDYLKHASSLALLSQDN